MRYPFYVPDRRSARWANSLASVSVQGRMMTVVLLALLQESPDEVVRALMQESAVARGEAVDKLVAEGRPAIPRLRKAMVKEPAVREEAENAIARIGTAEVKALLKNEGHSRLDALVRVTHETLTRVLPHCTIELLPADEACKACRAAERTMVVNDLTDGKGAPLVVRKPEDLVRLFREKARDEPGIRRLSAAVLYVLRAAHPRAHVEAVVPSEGEAYLAPEKLNVEKQASGSLVRSGMVVGHQYNSIRLSFGMDGALSKVELVADGPS